MKFLKFFVTFIFSILAWFLISYGKSSFSYGNIIIGIFISIITAWLTRNYFIGDRPLWLLNLRRIYIFIFYIPLLIFQWIKQGLKTSWSIITNNYDGNCIVKIPTEIKTRYGMLLLSSAISVSPGTLVMDIEDDENNDKKYLYVHCTNIDDAKIDDAENIVKEEHETWIRRICEK